MSDLLDRILSLNEAQFETLARRFHTLDGTRTERAELIIEQAAQQEPGRLNAAIATVRAPDNPDVWLEHRHRKRLTIGGVSDRSGVPVSTLVLPRLLMMERDSEGNKTTIEVDLITAMQRAEQRRAASPEVSGLAILGDPGSGKTSLIQYLTWMIWENGPLTVGLPPRTAPIAISIGRLRELQRARGKERLEDILRPKLLQAVIEHMANRDGYPGAGRALLQQERPLLLLIDGLDEVADAAQFEAVCAWLSRELRGWPSARFVLTSRRRTWRLAGPLRSRLVAARLLDYSVEEAAIFLHPMDSRHSALARVYRSPLLLLRLSAFCQQGPLPPRAPEQHAAFVGFLLQLWAARRPEGTDRRARRLLQAVAWQVLCHHADDCFTAADVTDTATLALLGRQAGEVLAELARDSGVIIAVDFTHFQFLHPLFVAVLAAEHAQEHRFEAALLSHLDQPRWEATLQHALSLPGLGRALLRQMVAQPLAGLGPLLSLGVERTEDHGALLGVLTPDRDAADLRVALRLLGPLAAEAARPLLSHADPEVAALASALVGVPAPVVAPIAGSVLSVAGMELLGVPPGELWMGSSRDPAHPTFDEAARENELPAHRVRVPRGFYLGRYPVSNAQYRAFIEATGHPAPETFSLPALAGDALPVTGVSWDDARAFCAWLTEQLQHEHPHLRAGLPSEAEWEWAARGAPEDGRLRRFPWGNEPPTPAHTGGEAIGQHPAGAGPFGHEDLVGLVWQWCATAYTPYPALTRVTDTLARRLWLAVRGGPSESLPRAAARDGRGAGLRVRNLGFRVMVTGEG